MGANRLGRVTPLEGLYLSGHWTHPGGGVVPSIAAGVLAGQVILGYSDSEFYLGALEKQGA